MNAFYIRIIGLSNSVWVVPIYELFKYLQQSIFLKQKKISCQHQSKQIAFGYELLINTKPRKLISIKKSYEFASIKYVVYGTFSESEIS